MFHKWTIEELSAAYQIAGKRMNDARANAKIALIDNEHVNAMADSLRKAGFAKVIPLPNISAMDEIAPYDVVLIDVKGIGGRLLKGSKSATLEGLAVAQEIKRMYPRKKVIVFSAMLNEYEDHYILHGVVDDMFSKDEDVTIRNKKIDRCIYDRIDPVKTWKEYRVKLLCEGVSIYKVAELENEYVSSILNRRQISVADVEKIIGTTATIVEIIKGIVEIVGIAIC